MMDNQQPAGQFAVIFFGLLFCLPTSGFAFGQDKPFLQFNPETYVCYRVDQSLKIDGVLNEDSWQEAFWTDYFTDIEGEAKPEPRFKTRAKMLWDDRFFYIAAYLEEPHLWATLKQRDAVIFHDNDFEVFIDPEGDTHHYYELEVNALGTFWDLMLTKPYRNGGRALDAWDIRGLKVGIDLKGTLNEPGDIDTGWTIELAIPWKVLEEAAPNGQPPRNGDQWRINFSRVQWQIVNNGGLYEKKINPGTGEPFPEDNWVWSPQGLINMHYPERWGYVRFSDTEAGNGSEPFERHPEEKIKWYLRELYYLQHEFYRKNGRFTGNLDTLGAEKIRQESDLDKHIASLSDIEVAASQDTFEMMIRNSETGKRWYIREDSRVWKQYP